METRPTLFTFCQNLALMGSSRKQCKALKMKVTDAHKTPAEGPGQKKWQSVFKKPFSHHNVVKQWQLAGTVEVKLCL